MAKLMDLSQDGDTLHLRIHAPRFDAAAARDFKTEIQRDWPPAAKRLDIDMHSVEFLDSSGIGALLSVYKRLASSGEGGVRLLNVRPVVQSVFELMRMHRIFDIQSI